MTPNSISRKIAVFKGRIAPENGTLIGYGAIIDALELPVPLPDTLVLISERGVRKNKAEQWQIFPTSSLPEDTLYKHLVFSLKHEGVNLLVLKKLFECLTEQETVQLLQEEPLGQYSRKLWFLCEWLMGKELPIPNLQMGNYVDLIDKKKQFALSAGQKSKRHRIINNLPGTVNFCPLIFKTEKLEKYISSKFTEQKAAYFSGIRKDILQRASAFLLLKDSKASFTIEGENPRNKRTARWGQAIGQAGNKDLSIEELVRLQQLVIENSRFVDMGLRQKGGFVGEHDRITGEPIPEHISAKWQDVELLTNGLISTNKKLSESEIDSVLAAAMVAFGFVFIHPFEDGNGRIHRYLIHHILAKKRFSQQGIIFPISASILDHIDDYRIVLETVSHPILEFIDWKETKDHNVEVLNDTIDYYRYYDATKQAEFLYDCVNDTIQNIIPTEINYLQNYDEFKRYLDNEFEMPDKMVSLLVRFLEQNNGKLSKRAIAKEFTELNANEIREIEEEFESVFS